MFPHTFQTHLFYLQIYPSENEISFEKFEKIINEQKISFSSRKKIIDEIISLHSNVNVNEDLYKCQNVGEQGEESIDIVNQLREIMNKENEFYNFYSYVNEIISSQNDGHFKLHFTITIDYRRIVFKMIKYELEFKIVRKLEGNEFYIIDLDGNEVGKLKTINGVKTEEFLLTFGDRFSRYKNKHSKIVNSIDILNEGNLIEHPLPVSHLRREITMKVVNDEQEEFEIINKYHLKRKLTENIKVFKSRLNANNHPTISRSSEYKNNFKCWMDNNLKVYTIIIRSLDVDIHKQYMSISRTGVDNSEMLSYFKAIEICAGIIRETEYPIQLILEDNLGGDLEIGLAILKMINRNICNSFYTRFKNSDEIKMKELINLNVFELIDVDTKLKMTHQNYQTIFDDKITIEYCPNVQSSMSKLFNVQEKYMSKLRMFKPIDPHRIIVFTDTQCFSACALLTHIIDNYKIGRVFVFGSVSIEYGNPVIGSSPTIVSSTLDRNVFKKNHFSLVNFYLTVPILSVYINGDERNKMNTIPIENCPYETTNVLNVNHFSYNEFTEFTKKQFKNRITCNPLSNYELHDIQCNDNKNHLVGSRKCNSNGYWNKKDCSTSYCFCGYYFNNTKKQCVRDPSVLCFDYPVDIK